MNKQEEIREGIEAIIRERGYDIWSVAGKDGIEQFLQDELNQILSYLHSQGCVLKVDRELPKWLEYADFDYAVGYRDCAKELVATIPIINT